MTTTDIALNVDTCNISITEIENEPRARDLDIGKRLGFSRPRDIRQLIERNLSELESFGAVARRANETKSGRGRVQATTEYWLNEEQALLVATISNAPNAPAVRSMLIRTFVAWRKGHLGGAGVPSETLEQIERSFGIVRMLAHKVTETEKVVHALPALVETVNALVSIVQPNVPVVLADGVTAGEACDLAKVATKYPRGLSARVSKRLTQVCAGRGITVPVTRLGRVRAQIFPTHIVREWLDVEGRALIRRWIEEKVGQRVLPFRAPAASPDVGEGLAIFRLNGESVLVDTTDLTHLGGSSLVIRHDGTLAVEDTAKGVSPNYKLGNRVALGGIIENFGDSGRELKGRAYCVIIGKVMHPEAPMRPALAG